MTRDELIENSKHAFMGMVLDAWGTQRAGESYAHWLKGIGPRVETLLGILIDKSIAACMEEQALLNKPAEARELFGGNKKGKGKEHGE